MQEQHLPFYIPNPKIVFENIDNEIIMIDFEKGNYYSLHKMAAQIWKIIENGATIEQILAKFGEVYGSEIESIQIAIIEFIQQLASENLIITTTTKPIAGDNAPFILQPLTPFEPPQLETYTDMNHLLLLDPIHDVDPVKGWPQEPSLLK